MALGIKTPSLASHLLFWSVAIAGLLADLYSKAAVFNWLSGIEQRRVSLIGDFLSFTLRENAGAAFSIASGQRAALIIVSALAFIGIIAAFEMGAFVSKGSKAVAAIFLAGVGGNLYDRVFNEGLVRDFIDVNLYVNNYHWPTFNIADSLLCIAVGICVIDVFRDVFKKKETEG